MALTITDPNNDGDLWIECTCGACGYHSKITRGGGTLGHRRTCRSKEAYPPKPAPVATQEAATVQAATTPSELAKYARSVRRTAMVGDRDLDLVTAVRYGYLSVNDAMNTDD